MTYHISATGIPCVNSPSTSIHLAAWAHQTGQLRQILWRHQPSGGFQNGATPRFHISSTCFIDSTSNWGVDKAIWSNQKLLLVDREIVEVWAKTKQPWIVGIAPVGSRFEAPVWTYTESNQLGGGEYAAPQICSLLSKYVDGPSAIAFAPAGAKTLV